MKPTFQAALVIASALLTATAGAHGLSNTSADYGNAAQDTPVDRTVVIKPDTKSVSVTNGETVQFQVEGKSFVWHFSTFQPEAVFALAKIAPEDSKVGDVHVYALPDPIYR